MESRLLRKFECATRSAEELTNLLFWEAQLSFPDVGLIEIKLNAAGEVWIRCSSKSVIDVIAKRESFLSSMREMIKQKLGR